MEHEPLSSILQEVEARLGQGQDLLSLVWAVWVDFGRPGGRRFLEEEVYPRLYSQLPASPYDSRSVRTQLRDFSRRAPLREVQAMLRRARGLTSDSARE